MTATRRTHLVLLSAVAVLTVTVVLRSWVVDVVTVTSDSMAPSLCDGDPVLLERLSDPSWLTVDDIVTFRSPVDGALTIKRVVGVGGDVVAIEDARLVVDGRHVPEPYVDLASIDGVYFGPVTVPTGAVFVMGDHRETSVDSRRYGPVPLKNVTGRLLFPLWPSSCPTTLRGE